MDFDFNPIRATNDKDRAQLAQQKTTAIVGVYNADLISKATAMKELRHMSSEVGMFDSITDEDIDAAEKEALFPMGESPIPGMENDPNAVPPAPAAPGAVPQAVPGQGQVMPKPQAQAPQVVPQAVQQKPPADNGKIVPLKLPQKREGGVRVG
jgi:hypothetical protein